MTGTKSEPGTLGYEWFAGADGKRFRWRPMPIPLPSRARFAGSVVRESVPKPAAVCAEDRLDLRFYGAPGRRSRQWPPGFGAVVFQYWM